MERIKTWRWDWALAGWNFRPVARSDGRFIPLDLESPEVRCRWLQRFLGQLPGLLGDFGYITKIQCSSQAKGENVCAVDWRADEGRTELMTFLGQTNDIFEVLVNVNLTCQGRDLESLEIEGGAAIWVNILLDESGTLVAREDPVYISVSLNADIYAPQSHADVQDNALLASLNGPRLAGFLERIERDVPAQLYATYDDQYPGMLGPRGFKVPPDATSKLS